MAQFTLNWDNSEVLASGNSTGQRASYRRKITGGSFITTGFTPPNDLATTVVTTNSPNSLLTNNVYEFRIETLCTSGGPILNDNGIREAIIFECLVPDLDQDSTSGTITLDLTGIDITKVRFTLRRESDDVIMGTPQLVNVVANTATTTISGLTGSTDYYWQYELYAIVQGVEVISSSFAHLGAVCGNYPFTTDVPITCPEPTGFQVTLNDGGEE